ncbi:MAG: CxxC-x17-CxxC domain-containing protein [Candidatus Paceibacterota bacterium]|jgi:CxxC-x17-CxxC domain-containing protein
MANFNKIFDRDRRDTGPRERDFKKRDSGGRRSFGGRDRGDRERPEMHEAVCSDCGKRCEVPFKPTGDKPIYCSQCFTNHGGASRSERPERGGRERSRFGDRGDRPMFDATCDTCGKRFQLPFRPTGEKPVYCNDCFDREGGSSTKSVEKPTNQYKEQFEQLNAKLDRILKVLAPTAPVKEEKKEVVIKKKETIKKPVKKVIAKKPVAKKKAKK